MCVVTGICMGCKAQLTFDTSFFVRSSANLYSIVISKNDSVIYKKYFNGKMQNDLFNNQSLTKSVISILTGIAIDKGYIVYPDEKIADFFPTLKNDTDRRKRTITIREIMNQASGLWHEDLDSADGIAKYLSLSDPSSYTLQQPLLSTPSTVFHYNNAATHLLSVILTKATKMSTLQFAEKYLFQPLHITAYNWMKMKDGYYDGCGLLSLYLRTEDMNKAGRLLLHKGSYDGKAIVSSKWIEALEHPPLTYHTPWGIEHSLYALCWYHASVQNYEVVYGLGWGGQFLIVVPALKAVISVNQNPESATAVRQSVQFLNNVLPLILQCIK